MNININLKAITVLNHQEISIIHAKEIFSFICGWVESLSKEVSSSISLIEVRPVTAYGINKIEFRVTISGCYIQYTENQEVDKMTWNNYFVEEIYHHKEFESITSGENVALADRFNKGIFRALQAQQKTFEVPLNQVATGIHKMLQNN